MANKKFLLAGIIVAASIFASSCVTTFVPAAADEGYAVGADVTTLFGAPVKSQSPRKVKISDIPDSTAALGE